MSKTTLTEGLEVYYKNFFGTIRFVCENYITVCIRTVPNERARDLCLIVYPNEHHLIKLAKESTK